MRYLAETTPASSRAEYQHPGVVCSAAFTQLREEMDVFWSWLLGAVTCSEPNPSLHPSAYPGASGRGAVLWFPCEVRNLLLVWAGFHTVGCRQPVPFAKVV